MKETLHYLLMTDHFLFQKTLFGKIKETGLSIGQPKVLDYLKEHDGTTQREIAAACQIEPASLTSILNGMEKANLIERKTLDGNRRSWHIFLTEKGKEQLNCVDAAFTEICCVSGVLVYKARVRYCLFNDCAYCFFSCFCYNSNCN